MHVLIVGAGTGGLALAHALKRAGIGVSVYERDLTPNADTGGYRVGISPAGSRALNACVPPENYDLFVATCARAPPYFNMLTEHFSEVLCFELEGAAADAMDGEKNVIRKTLRRVLLTGLEDHVSFGKGLVSYAQNFNADFNVSFTEEQQREGGIEYNYRREAAWQVRRDDGIATRMSGTPVADNAAMTGTDVATYTRERPGMSAFVLEDGVAYHTYSTYARGLDGLWGYQWLDRAPKGRNETGVWWRRHDEYDKP